MTTNNEKKPKTQPPPVPVPIPEPEYFDTCDDDAEFVRDFGYSSRESGNE
jgi:hypothetical protein